MNKNYSVYFWPKNSTAAASLFRPHLAFLEKCQVGFADFCIE